MSLIRASALPALLVLLLAITGLYLNSQRGLLADDDNLWLHFISEKIVAPSGSPDLERQAITLVKDQQASETSLRRLTERSGYLYNYALPVLGWHELGRVLPTPQTTADYPAYIATFLCFTLPATSLIAWLVLIGVLLRLQRPELWMATLTGLSLIAALMLLPNNPPMMTLLAFNNIGDGLRNFTAFVLNPWHGFSIYSFTPRNNLIVLVLAVFLLRWSGHTRTAYLLMLPLFLIHSSLSLLVMVHLLALDLLRQREKLRDLFVIAAIGLGMGYGLWRETLWNFVSDSRGPIIAVLAILGLGLIWMIWAPRPLLGAEKLLSRPYTWLQQQPAPAAEALLLMLFWIASAPPAFLISLTMDPLQNQYFWHQLQGRAIGAIGPVIFVGLAFYLKKDWLPRLTALCMIIWLAGFGWHAATRPSPYATALAQAEMHEAYLSGHMSAADYKYLSGPGFVLSEQTLYYALGQMMVMGNSRWDDLQRIAVPGGR